MDSGALEFSFDWTSAHVPQWSEVLAPWVGAPDVRALEIGVFEGRSTIWTIENVLTGSGSRIDCIDPFSRSHMAAEMGLDPGDYEARFFRNLAGYRDHLGKVFHSTSSVILPYLPGQYYDFIYLDGDHAAGEVLLDCIECWRILRAGGVLIADDYTWQGLRSHGPTAPRVGYDRFLEVADPDPEILFKDDQLIMRRPFVPGAKAKL